MPYDTTPVPLSADYREALTLPPESGQQLTNVNAWRGGLKKAPGFTMLGAVEALSAVPKNFFDCIFPDGTHQLIAIGPQRLQVWNGAAWGSNISGVAGRSVIPLLANGHYSVVNTLGKVYIAGAGASSIHVYDPTQAPPADLVELTTGVGVLTCRVILPFGDRLVLVRTSDVGVDQQTTIRWNALTTGPVNGFDTALVGADVRAIIETSSEPLTGGFVIGERAFLTKAHEILELSATDNPDSVFAVQSRVSGLGLLCPHSVAVVGNVAFFVGADNIYQFNGEQMIPIGDPILPAIEAQLFFATETQQLFAQGAAYPARDEYHLLLGSDLAPLYFVYDYRRQRWSNRTLNSTVVGTVSGVLSGDGPQTIVVNGATGRTRTAFRQNEAVTTVADYSTEEIETRWPVVVATRKLTPKRVGYRGVVEPAATDRMNILWEVRFSGQASVPVTVLVNDDDNSFQSQVVTTDLGGRGTAYFNFPFQTLTIRFETALTTPSNAFKLSNVIGYKWTPGGMHLTADPS